MCSFVIFLGIVISVSSYSWFGLWLGMEIIFISAIPLLSSIINTCLNGGLEESVVKYFLVQSVGSIIVVLGAVMLSSIYVYNVYVCLVLGGLFVNLGVFPFYSWIPSVMGGLTWDGCFVVGCVQKVIPFIFLSDILLNYSGVIGITMFSGVITSVVGGLGGLSQVLLRSLLSYSSVNHIGWAICILCCSTGGGYLYFLFYCLIGGSLFFLFSLYDINSCLYLNFQEDVSVGMLSIALIVSLFSLGGLPPFLGFFGNLLGFTVLYNNALILGFLVLSSLLALVYYLIVISSLMTSVSYINGSLSRRHNWWQQEDHWFKVGVLLINIMGPFTYGFIFLV